MPNNQAAKEIKILLEKYLKLDQEIAEDLFNKIDRAIDQTVLDELSRAQQEVKVGCYIFKTSDENTSEKTPESLQNDLIQKIEGLKLPFKSATQIVSEAEAEGRLEKIRKEAESQK